MKKLHIGSGHLYFDGWINIDLETPEADIHLDVTKKLPYRANSVDFIYSEHFIEHITVKDGVRFMKECLRVLKPGGVIRFATPDLDYLAFKYFFFWRWQDWIRKYGYGWLGSNCEMLNTCFYEWGHRYLYNGFELKRRLIEAGFSTQQIYRPSWNKSQYPELTNRETRKDSKLVMEAVKS